MSNKGCQQNITWEGKQLCPEIHENEEKFGGASSNNAIQRQAGEEYREINEEAPALIQARSNRSSSNIEVRAGTKISKSYMTRTTQSATLLEIRHG